MSAQVAFLGDGRLHLAEGPIDLVIEAFGDPSSVRAAYADAARKFDGLLAGLCTELSLLRRPVRSGVCPAQGPVARRMWLAVAPFADMAFITPMAAVAGAVAEEILTALVRPGIDKAYVNNGGDIALHLGTGQHFTVGMIDRPDGARVIGRATISHEHDISGIATSGAHGRSFSLGIADAVTILARTASSADAAATMVANAVDLPGYSGIIRARACDLQSDSDLGERLVTRHVPALSRPEVETALAAGCDTARQLVARGLIMAASLHLQGETRAVGEPAVSAP